MNLLSRIKKLEDRRGINKEPMANIIVSFAPPGKRSESYLKIIPLVGRQWYDGDWNPVGEFEYNN